MARTARVETFLFRDSHGIVDTSGVSGAGIILWISGGLRFQVGCGRKSDVVRK